MKIPRTRLARQVAAAVPEPVRAQVERLGRGDVVGVRHVRDRWRGRATELLPPDEYLPAGTALHPAVAAVVDEFDAHDVQDETLAAVQGVMDLAGIECVLAGGPPRRIPLLVAPAQRRTLAIRALKHELKDREWVVRTDGSTVRVFRYLAAATGLVLAGPELGVDVAFWAPADGLPRPDGGTFPADSLLAPGSSTWAPDLPAAARRGDPGVYVVDALPHVFAMTEPIDVVYTWVDDSDETWRRRRDAARDAAAGSAAHETADHPARFTSRDELRYSLRSLHYYANWVNHIYLVTDGQRPAWLAEHEKVTVVDHRDIFTDPDALPVFNSHAIESQLHHIDGLSEHYLYFNDDVMLGRPARPEDFFHGNGIAKFFPAHLTIDLAPPSVADYPVMSAAKNNRALIRQLRGRDVTAKLLHTPFALHRSVMEQLEQEIPDVFARVARSTFRSPDDVSVSAALGPYYACAVGKALPDRIDAFYVDLAKPEAPRRLAGLAHRRDATVICLNDVDTPSELIEEREHLVRRFLANYYPVPTPWENLITASAWL